MGTQHCYACFPFVKCGQLCGTSPTDVGVCVCVCSKAGTTDVFAWHGNLVVVESAPLSVCFTVAYYQFTSEKCICLPHIFHLNSFFCSIGPEGQEVATRVYCCQWILAMFFSTKLMTQKYSVLQISHAFVGRCLE
jgi:hypothetical protein